MGASSIPSVSCLTRNLLLGAGLVFGQTAEAQQAPAMVAPLPELMMAQLHEAVQSATAEVLPANTTVTIGGSGMVFPPLALPNPADPAFVNSLNQGPLGLEAWTGWDDWRESLAGVIEAGSSDTNAATSLFLEATNAAITQAVYSTEPNFDLLSIYQTPQQEEPAAVASNEPETTSDAGFFSQ